MFCSGCGLPDSECDGGCIRPLDPPRFCKLCGRRLSVRLSPTRVEARCRDHGLAG